MDTKSPEMMGEETGEEREVEELRKELNQLEALKGPNNIDQKGMDRIREIQEKIHDIESGEES